MGSGKRQKFEKHKKKLPLQTQLLFVSRWVRCAVKSLQDFTEGNSRKSQIKAIKTAKNTLIWASII